MSVQTRRVILDGNSTALTFTGVWTQESDSSAYLGTLTTTSDAIEGTAGDSYHTMVFMFDGTEMTLVGKARGRSSNAISANIKCTIDFVPTSFDDPGTGENFACVWKGKKSTGFSGNFHVFSLTLPVAIPGVLQDPLESVSVDSVWYLPTPDSTPPTDLQAMVEYDHTDPHIVYTPENWEPLEDDGGNALVATQAGSSATVLFTGTKVVWEGWTPAGYGLERSSATYWIDGSEPVTFDLDPLASDLDPTVHGIKLIEVDGLSEEEAHNLTVVYNGPSTPLVLDRLLVQGGDFRIEDQRPTSSSQSPIAPSITTSFGTPARPPRSSLSATKPSIPFDSSGSVPTGAIVGGIVGGLALVTLALVWFFARRKREKRQAQPPNRDGVPHFIASPPPIPILLPRTTAHTPRPNLPTANPWTTTRGPANHQQPQNDSSALRDTVGHGPPAGPSTDLPAAHMQQLHGIATTQGDLTLAGRDVHMHKHTHKHYHADSRRTWMLAMHPDAASVDQSITTHNSDEATANAQLSPLSAVQQLDDEPPRESTSPPAASSSAHQRPNEVAVMLEQRILVAYWILATFLTQRHQTRLSRTFKFISM
ncbi:hypothetical protein BKA70DRAFT_1223270 [Coprinopsis sp. MPI-PUGE-AT-0042]|nr:hypothetical protein BKA70DRAFT_1223270 [Coprinopsis sp. MPI-PUGE-AT-0042]